MEAVELEQHHLDELCGRLADHQKPVAEHLKQPAAFETAKAGEAWAVLDDDGSVFAASGIAPFWPGRGSGWAIVQEDLGVRRLKFLTKTAHKVLADTSFRRVEVTVDTSFRPGVIWSLLLGFKYEGKMINYGLDGEDHYLLAFTKE